MQQTQRRQEFGEKVQTTAVSLAKHCALCLLGEFTCTLDDIPGLVGIGHYIDMMGNKMRGLQKGNKQRFQKLIEDLNLVGLNTWGPTLGPTFVNTLGRSSRIDFVFTTMFHADRLAKQVGYLHDAPFLQDGPKHIPMLVNLAYSNCRSSRNGRPLFHAHIKNRCIHS